MLTSSGKYADNRDAWHTQPTKTHFHVWAVTAYFQQVGPNITVGKVSANIMISILKTLNTNGPVQDALDKTLTVKSDLGPEVTLITQMTQKIVACHGPWNADFHHALGVQADRTPEKAGNQQQRIQMAMPQLRISRTLTKSHSLQIWKTHGPPFPA